MMFTINITGFMGIATDNQAYRLDVYSTYTNKNVAIRIRAGVLREDYYIQKEIILLKLFEHKEQTGQYHELI